MTMKTTAVAALGLVLLASAAGAEATRALVMKSPSCGCCTAWMEHLRESGFATEGRDLSQARLAQVKAEHGVPAGMTSCHTAVIDGYVIEGHVPASDIRRLLAARPDAVGLAVPGMPMGSPGMDFGADQEAYDVFLITSDGRAVTFSSHPAH